MFPQEIPPVQGPPPWDADPVVEAYKKDIDRTLILENLKLTVEQRLVKLMAMQAFVAGWRGAAWRRGAADPPPASASPGTRE